MRLFLLNTILALIWGAVTGTFTPAVLGAGFVLGYAVLLLARPALGPSPYYLGLWRALAFLGFYLWELLLSSLRVAHDVLTPRLRARPAIVGVPLDARTDAEITALANLITLTPGTLSLDVADDRRTLYVHAMYLDDDGDALRRDLKHRMERRVLRLLRPDAPPAPSATAVRRTDAAA